VKRYKEQLHGREKQAAEAEERARQAQQRADNLKTQTIAREKKKLFASDDFDSTYFLELYKEDSELADDLAKTLTINGKQASNAQEILAYFGESTTTVVPNQPKPVTADDIRGILEQLLEEKEAKKAVNTYFDALDEGKKAIAQQKFNKLTEGRKLTKEDSQEIADMVIASVKDKEITITP
jgi:hypothetical protein